VVDPTMDVTSWLRKQLEQASPDLLRAMVQDFAEALMGAEADAFAAPAPGSAAMLCGSAGPFEVRRFRGRSCPAPGEFQPRLSVPRQRRREQVPRALSSSRPAEAVTLSERESEELRDAAAADAGRADAGELSELLATGGFASSRGSYRGLLVRSRIDRRPAASRAEVSVPSARQGLARSMR
jgi:hypothetical protein